MITRKLLRSMCGVVRINETKGLLFDDGSRFAYSVGEHIFVDDLGFKDRVWMKFRDNKLVGYDISGILINDQYGSLDVPPTTVIDNIITRKDLQTYDGQVIVYGRRPAVVVNSKIIYRDISTTRQPGFRPHDQEVFDRPPHDFNPYASPEEVLKSINEVNFWTGSSTVPTEFTLYSDDESVERNFRENDTILQRNGL